MENLHPNRVTLFDTYFTNNHICMMKILLHLLPPTLQKNIAVYIKYQELQYTMQYFHTLTNNHNLLFDKLSSIDTADLNTIFEEILPYCTPQEKQSFTHMRNMCQSFQNMKDMMEMLETMKELFPENFDGSGDFNSEIFANMSGMFGGRDMSQMADLFQAFQSGS